MSTAHRAEEDRLRRQLQAPRGRKIQATAVGKHRAHAGAARRLLDGPEPRAGIMRRNIHQERTVMQARIGPRACDGCAEHPGDARTHAAHQLTGRRPRIAPDPLLDVLDERFSAGRYHSLAAHEPIPAELVVTARADDGTVMAVRHTSQPTHGLQFHPESVLTPQGPEMMAAFLRLAVTA